MTTVTSASLRCQIQSGRLCVTNSGKVYDLTEFADRHPGGRELVESNAGRDVTQVMRDHQSHVHSQSAYKILDKYYIGDLRTSAVKRTPKLTDGLKNGHKNGHINGYANGHAGEQTVTSGDQASQEVGESIDDLVDWSKPVFWQVGNLGDKYFEWVHSPIDTSLRLFYSNIVEQLSKSYWWLVLLYWVPISSYILWYSYCLFLEEPVIWNIVGIGAVEVSVAWMPVLFVCGVLLWTFDEYVVHRWLFHCKPPSSSKFLITAHFLFHGQHHKSPMDKHRLVFPPIPATGLGLLIFWAYTFLGPTPIHLVFLSGTIFGYLCYDLIHYYLHHGQPSLSYFKNLKTYHTKHHFKQQNLGFGISSKLWDYPFKTLLK